MPYAALHSEAMLRSMVARRRGARGVPPSLKPVDTEETSLPMHVKLCEHRYGALRKDVKLNRLLLMALLLAAIANGDGPVTQWLLALAK